MSPVVVRTSIDIPSAARQIDRVLLLTAPRCDHGLVGCRRCRTATPGQNRHWRQHTGPTAPTEGKGLPTLNVLRNRADWRAAGRTATAGRGRRRRAGAS